MKNLVIEAYGLKKYYQRGNEVVKALDGVDLEVELGDFISIVGASGSGKTTLMNLISLIDRPTSGRLKINNIEVQNLTESELINIRRENIGFIFQRFYLIPTLTVKENILLQILFYKKKIEEKFLCEVIEKVGLQGKEKLLPPMLSGGDRQKVSIARALIKKPKIILADEPTGRLEEKASNEIINIFQELINKRITIIIATHNLELAKLTSKIIYLQDGKIIPKEKSYLYL
jgi:putative ABC transport system ATP-binding protein